MVAKRQIYGWASNYFSSDNAPEFPDRARLSALRALLELWHRLIQISHPVAQHLSRQSRQRPLVARVIGKIDLFLRVIFKIKQQRREYRIEMHQLELAVMQDRKIGLIGADALFRQNFGAHFHKVEFHVNEFAPLLRRDTIQKRSKRRTVHRAGYAQTQPI